jgi:hypothetical protein
MESLTRFDPSRRRGLAFHFGALILCVALLITFLFFATAQETALVSVLLLVGTLLFSLPLPLLLYRLYALLQSGYWLGREGLRLRWGLRQVDLPHDAIVDVAHADELENPIALPRWTWPGGVTGETKDAELGTLEFLAAEKNGLVLLGTKERVFVISPSDPQKFVELYKQQSERGSLRSFRARSISPSFVLVEAWAQPRARQLFIPAGALALGLLLLVGILAPGLPSVSLGFAADGLALPAVASLQLFLLPAINLFFFVGSLFFGLLFFREPKGLNFSYLLWGSSLFTSLLFLGAVLFSI